MYMLLAATPRVECQLRRLFDREAVPQAAVMVDIVDQWDARVR